MAEHRKASSEGSRLPNSDGSGLAWLGRGSGDTCVPSRLRRKEGWRASFEEGESGTPAPSTMAGILIARDTHFPLQPRVPRRHRWGSQRPSPTKAFHRDLLPPLALARAPVRSRLVPLLPPTLAPALLLPVPPRVQLKEGAFFAHLMPLRLLFSWCYSPFSLGSTKVDVGET